MSASKILGRAAAIATLAAAVTGAHAAVWTTVGSAGTVDELDLGIADLVLGEARMRASAPAGSVLNIRYNVVSLQGFSGPGQYLMRVRFRDNGGTSRVQLALRRYNHTGPTTNLVSFDSNAYPAQVGYQTQQRCIALSWNFDAGPHFVEATMTKSGVGGQPALGTIQLIPANCIP